MKKDTEITEVIFRRWVEPETINKTMLALFPYEIDTLEGSVMSYMMIGQHGGADYTHCMGRTVPATPKEYADIKSELEDIGYNLKIIKRRNYDRYLAKWQDEINRRRS